MEEIIKAIAINTGLFVEGLAAVIILVASGKAVVNYFCHFFLPVNDSEKQSEQYENLRIRLGTSVAVALELLLGADVLMTAVTPSWNDLGMLAAIATLRTTLNYFLGKELKSV